jgi:hypothetical protein
MTRLAKSFRVRLLRHVLSHGHFFSKLLHLRWPLIQLQVVSFTLRVRSAVVSARCGATLVAVEAYELGQGAPGGFSRTRRLLGRLEPAPIFRAPLDEAAWIMHRLPAQLRRIL